MVFVFFFDGGKKKEWQWLIRWLEVKEERKKKKRKGRKKGRGEVGLRWVKIGSWLMMIYTLSHVSLFGKH